jgi:IS30 family transposase
MKLYYHLTPAEREEISIELAKGYSVRYIATLLNRSPSTISREISNNPNKQNIYRANEAEKQAKQRIRNAKRERKLDKYPKLREFVFHHLEKRWSPEQIAKKLALLYPNDMIMRISHESIYQYIYVLPRTSLKRQLAYELRRAHKNRRTRKGQSKSCPIQDYLSIEERPKEIADRIVPGHWEGDLITGAQNKSAIGTLVERTTRFTLIVKLPAKDAYSVRKAFAKKFKSIPVSFKRSLTYDQGQEMAHHKLFTKESKIQVYFAHPHSPWERGSNENTNGLIRDFFPKGTDFSTVAARKLTRVQTLLNERPRKVLNWLSPSEAFNKVLHL